MQNHRHRILASLRKHIKTEEIRATLCRVGSAPGALQALHCLRDLEALRLAMKVSGAGDERRRLLRRIVDDESDPLPHAKRARRTHDDNPKMDALIRDALQHSAAASLENGWWCVTTAVLQRLDASRRNDAPPYARSVCSRLADVFFVRSVACLPRGAADELRCDAVDAVDIKAVRCRLDPNGYAAQFLVRSLLTWCDRCERADPVEEYCPPPAYPPLAGDHPIHDAQRYPELNDITKEEVTDGMRELWNAPRFAVIREPGRDDGSARVEAPAW